MIGLFHPHQKLWNWRLTTALRRRLPAWLYRCSLSLITLLDTLWLGGQALRERAVALGIVALWRRKARLPADLTVVYLDLGLHRKAAELIHSVRDVLPGHGGKLKAYGFEANPESYNHACSAVSQAGLQSAIQVEQLALCRQDADGGRLRLHLSPRGLGDSLFAQRGEDYVEVPAGRLSDWIARQGIDCARSIVLLRMNIEGAEFGVLQDLREAGLLEQVDGYFGMWDDLSKIDPRADGEFRRWLDQHGVRGFSFNGRDIDASDTYIEAFPLKGVMITLRTHIIDYAIATALMRGKARVSTAAAESVAGPP